MQVRTSVGQKYDRILIIIIKEFVGTWMQWRNHVSTIIIFVNQKIVKSSSRYHDPISIIKYAIWYHKTKQKEILNSGLLAKGLESE